MPENNTLTWNSLALFIKNVLEQIVTRIHPDVAFLISSWGSVERAKLGDDLQDLALLHDKWFSWFERRQINIHYMIAELKLAHAEISEEAIITLRKILVDYSHYSVLGMGVFCKNLYDVLAPIINQPEPQKTVVASLLQGKAVIRDEKIQSPPLQRSRVVCVAYSVSDKSIKNPMLSNGEIRLTPHT